MTGSWIESILRTCFSAMILAGLCACGGTAHVGQAKPQAKAEVQLARAAGARVGADARGGFVVYPVFLQTDGTPAPTTSRAEMLRLLDAFRSGARAQFADTTSLVNPATRAQLPEAARRYVALLAPPSLAGDTAFVDVMSGLTRSDDGPIEETVFRYTFARAGSIWHFVRRALRYAA